MLVEDLDVMTSKRLGILVALVALWSLTGLGGFVSVPPCAVVVGEAHAGLLSRPSVITTCSGDPDQYTDSANGDPDQSVDGSVDQPADEAPSDPPPVSNPDRTIKVLYESLMSSLSVLWF